MNTHKRMRAVDERTNPCEGVVYWKWSKSLWYSAITIGALVVAPFHFTPGAAAAAFGLTVLTLCLGHTVGMHRRLIHESFQCPLWLERILVWLGVLVGIAGPHRIIYLHDIRDWAQKHPDCHPFFKHSHPWWLDWWQQQHCDIRLNHPPRLELEPRVRDDRFYRFLQSTWMLQQAPVALALWAIGGWSWFWWGGPVRLFLSLTGHWLVGYLAHNHGRRHWHIERAAVQGYNVPGFALLTMGESWHNNHHAYPESARLGVKTGEWDPGWLVVRVLQQLGWAWRINTPETSHPRPERLALD